MILSIKSVARKLWAFGLYPKSGIASFLSKCGRLPLCHYEEKRLGDAVREKIERREQNLSVGWAKFGKVVRFKFCGVSLIGFSLSEEEINVQQFYFYRSAQLLREYLNELKALNFQVPTKKGFSVFEPGCNCGGLLFNFADHYGAKIHGADIYAPAIKSAKRLDYLKEADFECADVIQSQYLKKFSDRHFDIVFVSSHFTHIMHVVELENYISELKRISSTIICVEIEEFAGRAPMSFYLKAWGFDCSVKDDITYGHFSH
ncbi:MAG: class I SAM-dependent methyltransferase [Alphaproteobacteria bacterium PRO2]|nr:class I SAM-dependent methyltransferase [Alphaproteobacteria bacterium PRO2]